MKEKEQRAIKKLLKLGIQAKYYDEQIFTIIKESDSEEMKQLFFEAYLNVVKEEGKERQRELERRSNSR